MRRLHLVIIYIITLSCSPIAIVMADTSNDDIKKLLTDAERGDARTQYKIGMYYSEGMYVEQDDALAVKWFRKAAEQGYAEAQYSLGRAYRNGAGVEKNGSEALKWFMKSADIDDSGTCPKEEITTTARNLCLGALPKTQAEYAISQMYSHGDGVPEDRGLAIQWLGKAANDGSSEAAYLLGAIYRSGDGVPKNDAEAVAWYRKAAEQGASSAGTTLITSAQYNLGTAYYSGSGVAKDYVLAYMWLDLAAAQGNQDAIAQRTLVEKSLTSDELAEGKRLSREWMQQHTQ